MGKMLIESVRAAHAEAQASSDEDFKAMFSVEWKVASSEELAKAEKRIGFPLPESYKRFVLEYGTFGIGVDPAYDHLGFRLIQVDEIKTVHQQLAEDHEESTTSAIAESVGLDESVIDATVNGAIFAISGHEDFYVFDRRSAADGLELKVGGVLMDDCELEYFAAKTDFTDDVPFEDSVLRILKERREENS